MLAEIDRHAAPSLHDSDIDRLSEQVAQWPEDEPARTALAIALASAGRAHEALEHFVCATSLAAGASQHRNLAVTLAAVGRVDAAVTSFLDAIRCDPGYDDAWHLLIELLRSHDRHAEAAVFLQQWIRSDRATPARLRDLGTLQLQAGDLAAAEASLRLAMDGDPHDVHTHAMMAVLRSRGNRHDEAIAFYEQALALHRRRPHRWPATCGMELARLGLRYETARGLADTWPDTGSDLDRPANATGGVVTVLLGCYGDHPEYSVRCIESVCGALPRNGVDVLIGLNACCSETVAAASKAVDQGIATGTVRSRHNLNKDPMLRLMLEQVRTPYVLWLDDDTHFIDPEWTTKFLDFIERNHPFDVAGQPARWGPHRTGDAAYMSFVRARPWWRSEAHLPPDLLEWVPFVLGGLFIARTRYLLQHDFPDRGMVKAMDDVALGELVLQQGGRLVPAPPEILATARIGDGERRGENFDLLPEARHH